MSEEDFSFSFLLGRVQSQEHEARLQIVAQHLDANKFSTTFSVVNGMAVLDVSPYSAGGWPDAAAFRLYAAEHVIHCLARRLADLKSQEPQEIAL